MKILFVPGIKTWPLYLWGWRKDLTKLCGAENFEIAFSFYTHWHHKKTGDFIQLVTEKINTYKPDIIIGHSFGGLIAKAAILHAVHAPQKLITMATPHHMEILGVKEAKDALQIPTTVPVHSVITYGGTYDIIVPNKYTEMPGSVHLVLPTTHNGFLLQKKVRAQVLRECVL